ncbi:MAG TPA: hypothetical protein PJ982_20090 [Lacipirellulaceae bacterium]|nr:hypothetical protein [Lacipirellulaceae bacterium]
MDDDAGAYLPTPDEIAAACRAIRRSWSPEERQRRRWGLMPGRRHARAELLPSGWTPPVVAVAEIAAAG